MNSSPASRIAPLLAVLAVASLAALLSPARAADTSPNTAATAGPSIIIDLSEPKKALATYFQAFQVFNSKAVHQCLTISDPAQTSAVDVAITYSLWQNYLERACIQKFGAEEGLKVLGRLRSYDDQINVDVKRLPFSNIDVDPIDNTKVTIFLKPEKKPIPEWKAKETYYLRRDGKEWKIDFVRTYGLDNTDNQENVKLSLAVNPRLSAICQKLAEQVKKGDFKTADDAKAAYSKAEEAAYEPAESQPAN